MKRICLTLLTVFALLALPVQAAFCADSGTYFNAETAQRLLDGITADPAVPGAVLYINGPEGQYTLTSGYARRDEKTPMTAEHGFYIASLSKMMTAAVTYKLAEQGKIALDAPISDYIDETFNGGVENFYTATIEQVLNHRDGMVDYLTLGYYEHAAGWPEFDASSPIDAVSLTLNKPALFEPGAEYAYGSTGYVLLGLMMETITGDDIQAVFAEQLFTPLGLEHTMFGTHPVPDFLARGYADIDKDCDTSWQSNMPQCVDDVTDIDWGDKLTDGGIISTAADLDKFLRALLADKTLLTPESLAHMMTATELRPDEHAAHGLTITHDAYGTSIGHMGQYPGYRSAAFYIPEHDTTLIFWTNGMFDMEGQFIARMGEFLGHSPTAE